MTNTEQDFEIFFANSEKYEHVKLPDSVKKILKPYHDGKTLHAFIHHDRRKFCDGLDDHRTMVLGYDKIDGTHIMPGYGVSCGMDNGYVHNWDTLAEEIAFSCPECKITE